MIGWTSDQTTNGLRIAFRFQRTKFTQRSLRKEFPDSAADSYDKRRRSQRAPLDRLGLDDRFGYGPRHVH